MGFYIDTRNMVRIHCFADAERVWNQAKPWRTEHASWRPLDGPRKKHMKLVKLSNDRGYECKLFNTAVVTYFTDGSVALRCYDSISTQSFAWCVRPTRCQPASAKGRMFWQVETDDGPRFYREGSEALMLRPTAACNWQLTTLPSDEKEWAYDPKKAAAVRKKLKPYAVWYAVASRLDGLPPRTTSYTARPTVECFWSAPDALRNYRAWAETLGSPRDILPVAYEVAGARYKSPVPHDRLPRSFA